MKRVLLISLFGIILLSSCLSLQERHLKTADKVSHLLYEGNIDDLHSLFALNPNNIGRDKEALNYDSKDFKHLVSKYGFPDIKKASYFIDKKDFIKPYKIRIPIHEGVDTLFGWRVKNVYLQVEFGPENVNNPSKIAFYEIVQDRLVYLEDEVK